ncbi:hypothetical protein D9C01_12690, partial [Corynebacterium diphtheriae]
MATARLRSAALADQIRTHTGEPLDALVAIAASTDVLSLPHDLPLIQITDATFPAICGFYPIATGLGASTSPCSLRSLGRMATGERLRTRLRGLRGQRSLPTHTMATARLRSAA